MLCRVESGNRKYHVCNYHGWAYDSGGKNIDIKDRKSACYSPAFDAEDHNLVPLARFANYKGLLFGSLSADVPPLKDYLGELKFFVDLRMEQGPRGWNACRAASPIRTMPTGSCRWTTASTSTI